MRTFKNIEDFEKAVDLAAVSYTWSDRRITDEKSMGGFKQAIDNVLEVLSTIAIKINNSSNSDRCISDTDINWAAKMLFGIDFNPGKYFAIVLDERPELTKFRLLPDIEEMFKKDEIPELIQEIFYAYVDMNPTVLWAICSYMKDMAK